MPGLSPPALFQLYTSNPSLGAGSDHAVGSGGDLGSSHQVLADLSQAAEMTLLM